MEPALIFVIALIPITFLVVWGVGEWQERQFEQQKQTRQKEVTSTLLEHLEEGFDEVERSLSTTAGAGRARFEGTLEGRPVELEIEADTEEHCTIHLTVFHEAACQLEDLTVYLKSPSGIGFYKKRKAGMVDTLALPDLENGFLEVDSVERRGEGIADEVSEWLVEVLRTHYEDFHVEPPEELRERFETAESLQDLEGLYEKLADEDPVALQMHVPGEVGVRDERIDVEWLFQGDTELLEGAIEFVRASLRLADALERAGSEDGCVQ